MKEHKKVSIIYKVSKNLSEWNAYTQDPSTFWWGGILGGRAGSWSAS